jgi:hypothetical protein
LTHLEKSLQRAQFTANAKKIAPTRREARRMAARDGNSARDVVEWRETTRN